MRWYDYWMVCIIVVLATLAGFVMLPGCLGGKMITGPGGQEIMAPPEGMTYDAKWNLVPISQPKPAPMNLKWLYVVAAVAIVSGVGLGYLLKELMLGFLVSGGGCLLIGVLRFLDMYPWAFWIPFGVGVAALVYLIYRTFRGKRAETALDAVVPAIEAMGAGNQSTLLKERIEANAGEALSTVKATVTAVKTKLGV